MADGVITEEMPKVATEGTMTTEDVETKDRSFDFFERLNLLIEEKQVHVEQAKAVLGDEAELRKHDKRWKALGIVYEEHDKLKNDPHQFINSLKERIVEVEGYDEELARDIRSTSLDDSQMQTIQGLAAELERLPEEQEIGFLKSRRYAQYISRINEFGDDKTVEGLRRAHSIATGAEKYYLGGYLEEVRQWPEAARTKGIGYFIRRLRAYLNNRRGGLASQFKDREVAEMISKSKAARRLLTYEREQKFFENVRDYIIAVRKDPNWIAKFVDLDGKPIKMSYYAKGGFHNNLKKHRNFIKIVREEFGNDEFADFLNDLEKKYKEEPSAEVETAIVQLDSTLKSAPYQTRNVILPAAEQLAGIFATRIKEIEGEMEKGLDRLKGFLRDRIKEIAESPKKSAARLMKRARAEESRIRRYWRGIRKRFDRQEAALSRRIVGSEKYAELIEENDLTPAVMNIKRINDGKSAWIKDMRKLTQMARRNPMSAARVAARVMVGAATAEESISMVDRISKMMEESVDAIQIERMIKEHMETNHMQDRIVLWLSQLGIITEESRSGLAEKEREVWSLMAGSTGTRR